MPACCQAGNGLKWSYSFVTSGTSVTAAEYQGYPVCRYGGQSAHQWRLVRLEPKLNVRFYSKILIVIEFVPFYGGRHVVVIISCIGKKISFIFSPNRGRYCPVPTRTVQGITEEWIR